MVRINPGKAIVVALALVLAFGLASAAAALFSAYRAMDRSRAIARENLTSLRAASKLEAAVLEQRGLASAYVLDGGKAVWAERLETEKAEFERSLEKARLNANSDAERTRLDRLERAYAEYDAARDRAMDLYRSGEPAAAATLLLDSVRELAHEVHRHSEELVAINEGLVVAALRGGSRDLEVTTLWVAVSAAVAVLAGLALVVVLFRWVLWPVRRLTEEVGIRDSRAASRVSDHLSDNLQTVSDAIQALREDVAEARASAAKDRSRLLSSDKLATVGKIAACVAHEIRNPITALKTWLYSIRLQVANQPELRAKCEIVESEFDRLDGIIRNFLEFSRPAVPRMAPVQIRDLVARTMELMSQRTSDIEIVAKGRDAMPMILGDSEQLKQVFINLILNAVEASPDGRIEISHAVEKSAGRRPTIVTRIRDHGPGLPQEVRERLFQPFVTTKEGGTGLGLFIANNIVENHGGRLEVEKSDKGGTTFAVRLPADGGDAEAG